MHRFLLAPLALLVSSSVFADNDNQLPDLLLEEIKRGKPIERISPKYPVEAARRGQEGWVVVSFVIDKEGGVRSPIIEQSSNPKVFDKATLKAINSWKFEPTTVNGEAIEQCKNSVRMDFTLAKDAQGARRKFVSVYKKIVKALDNDDLEEAQELIDKQRSRGAWNLYEDAWLSNAEARYYQMSGDVDGEIRALSRISSANKPLLDINEHLNSLARLFNLEVNRKEFIDAFHTAKNIQRLDKERLLYPRVRKITERIEQYIDGKENYLVQGKFNSDGVWRYQLARNSFGFSGDVSAIRKLDVRCENKFLTYKVAQDTTWTVPDSYGQCALYVYGDTNTTVNLIEVAQVSS